MSLFPKIDTPCPLRWKEMPSAERNFCTLCQRKVHNLSAMAIDERRAFLASCSGDTCVAYTVPRRRSVAPLAAGLGLAAALSFSPTMAAEVPVDRSPVEQASLTPTEPKADCDTVEEESVELLVMTGGVRNPQATQLELESLDNDQPELPRVGPDAFLHDAEFVASPESMPPR
jgi:hypothetical protein